MNYPTRHNEPIHPGEHAGYHLEGITKREYFAAQMLAGMAMCWNSNHGKDLPRIAVEMADALIDALNESPKEAF